MQMYTRAFGWLRALRMQHDAAMSLIIIILLRASFLFTRCTAFQLDAVCKY